jgi:hypothetical protein
MDNSSNTIQNNALASLAAHAPQHVLNSIKKASAHTGVNFAYLMQQANTESSFKPNAKAKTSSASGLYQFIESTWISMVKKYGDKYGMGNLARHIGSNGTVDNRAIRKEILALRNDPEKASVMAAELANDNREFLASHWGGKVGATELYFAHFMGAAGASAFLKERDENPLQQAAQLFPAAAKSNRNVFYDTRTGRARTMDEVYAFFDKKFDIKGGDVPGAAEKSLQVANAQNKGDIQSVIFSGGNFGKRAFGSLNSPVSSYHPLVANPLDLILLGQINRPADDENKYFF